MLAPSRRVTDVRITELKDDEAIIKVELVLVSDGEEFELEEQVRDDDPIVMMMVKEGDRWRWRTTECED